MEAGIQLLWYLGWVLAVATLVFLGFRLAGTSKRESGNRWLSVVLFGLVTSAVIALAQYAIVRNDNHLDLTQSRVFTPDASALELVDTLQTPVSVTYFGHDDDPKVKRLRVVLESLAKRSSLLSIVVTDPDKDPQLARRYQVEFYNVGIVEAAGRRVIVKTSNEVDIAIAIQKALRQRQTTICFVTGHGELEIDNHEFHTHVESLGGGTHNHGHSHGHAHIPVVRTTQHGVGRLRRSLEALGFAISKLNLLADTADVDCQTLAIINPRFPFLQSEITTLEAMYRTGTSLIVLLDLGAKLPVLNQFLNKQGIVMNDDVIVDEKQHHEQDIETLAVSSYPGHVITRNIAMTLFPGARSITVESSSDQVRTLVKGSVYSRSKYLHDAHTTASHQHGEQGSHEHVATDIVENHVNKPEPSLIVVKDAKETVGKLIVGGDADFLSNSYFPYLSNSALALAIFRWLVGEQDAVATAPALPVVQTIVMSQPQMRTLFVLLVIVIPIAVVLVGVFVRWKTKC